LVALAVYLVTALAYALFPAPVAAALAKEGLVEHASHVFLAVGALALAACALRHRRRAFAFASAFLLFVLLEETDWGAVYGWTPLADGLRALVGEGNLHNAWGGHSYLVFAIPPAAFYGPALLPERWASRARAFWMPCPLRRADALALLVLVFVDTAVAHSAGSDAGFDELSEACLYLLLAITALQGLRAGGSVAAPAGADSSRTSRR
jgi:hypothetical protein